MHKRTPHSRRKQYDSSYGAFPGGDPRLFSPDEDGTMPEELEAHRVACEAWNRGDKKAIPSAHTYTGTTPMDAMTIDGGVVLHVTEQRFGLGAYQFRVPILSRKVRLAYWRESKQRMIDLGFSDAEISVCRSDYF